MEYKIKTIDSYPNYQIDTNGVIYSKISNRILKPIFARYYVVSLYNEKGKRREYIHTLLLTTFVSPRPEGMLATHIDDNPHNNTLLNLRWGTYKQNNLDAIVNKRFKSGFKLTWDNIQEILNSPLTAVALAKKFNVSNSAIDRVRQGRHKAYAARNSVNL